MKVFKFVLFFLLSNSAFAQINLESTPLPIIVITTGDQEIIDELKITAWMGIIDNGPSLGFQSWFCQCELL